MFQEETILGQDFIHKSLHANFNIRNELFNSTFSQAGETFNSLQQSVFVLYF